MEFKNLIESQNLESSTNSNIRRYRESRNGKIELGLDYGISNTSKYTKGLLDARYFLIGADSGVGKTTVTDAILLYSWIDARTRGIPFKCMYYSFEISKTEKIAKFVAFFMKYLYNVVISVDELLGRMESLSELSPDQHKLVEKTFLFVENIVLKDIFISDVILSPTEVLSVTLSKMGEFGTVDFKEVTRGKEVQKVPIAFVRNSSNLKTKFLMVIDHLSLVNSDGFSTVKSAMDQMSKNVVILRNILNITALVVQQFNTDLLQVRREASNGPKSRKSLEIILPNRLDFGDSKATFRDADHVIGLVKPLDFDILYYEGFNTSSVDYEGIGEYLIIAALIKNRYGRSNRLSTIFLDYVTNNIIDVDKMKFEDHDQLNIYSRKLIKYS